MGLAAVPASRREAEPGGSGTAGVIMKRSGHIDFRRACTQPGGKRQWAAGVRARDRIRRQRGVTLVEAVLIVAIVGILASLVATTCKDYRDRVNTDQAVHDLVAISTSITKFHADFRRLPNSLAEVGRSAMLDPWGNPYQFISHTTNPKDRFRYDSNGVPINSDFDLYSHGRDGIGSAQMTDDASRDDIIRANNGAYFGLTSVYDP